MDSEAGDTDNSEVKVIKTIQPRPTKCIRTNTGMCITSLLAEQRVKTIKEPSLVSPQVVQTHLPIPEFVEGSSGGATYGPQLDLDLLTSRLQASASLTDDENIWNKGGKWAF